MKSYLEKKLKKLRGFTMVELVIAMLLTTMVTGIAVSVVNLLSKGYVGTNMETSLVKTDSEFLFKVNDNIKNAPTAFTMPQKSFTLTNLTAKWDYLGVMDNCKIPASISGTGKEEEGRCLVYAEHKTPEEYEKFTKLSEIPPHGSFWQAPRGGDYKKDGWFLVTVLGFTTKDNTTGYWRDYEMEFQPANSDGTDSKEIKYTFKAVLRENRKDADGKDEPGEIIGEDNDINTNVNTMLTSLNSLKVVYRGGKGNPATALAYCKDALPSDTATGVENDSNRKNMLVTFVLDYSGSMNRAFSSEDPDRTRIEVLKESVEYVLPELSKNGNVSVMMVPFSMLGMCNLQYPSPLSPDKKSDYLFNLKSPDELDRAKKVINKLEPIGETAFGDGIRAAYKRMLEYDKDNKGTETEHVLYLLTDGEMNSGGVTKDGRAFKSEEGEPFYGGLINFKKIKIYTGETDRYGNRYFYWSAESNPNYRYAVVQEQSTMQHGNAYNGESYGGLKEISLKEFFTPDSYFNYWAKKITDKYDKDKKPEEKIGYNSVAAFLAPNPKKTDDWNTVMEAFEGIDMREIKTPEDLRDSMKKLVHNVKNEWMFTGPSM